MSEFLYTAGKIVSAPVTAARFGADTQRIEGEGKLDSTYRPRNGGDNSM